MTRSCFSTLTSSNPPRSHSFGLKVQQTTSFGPLFTKFFTSFSQILQMSQHIFLFFCNPRLLTEVLDLSQFLITLFDFAKFMNTPASSSKEHILAQHSWNFSHILPLHVRIRPILFTYTHIPNCTFMYFGHIVGCYCSCSHHLLGQTGSQLSPAKCHKASSTVCHKYGNTSSPRFHQMFTKCPITQEPLLHRNKASLPPKVHS